MISVCFYYIKSRIKHTIDFRVLKNLTGSSVVKNLPAITGDPDSVSGLGRSPGGGRGNPLQYSPWRIPWTEEPGGLQSMGSQTVGHD